MLYTGGDVVFGPLNDAHGWEAGATPIGRQSMVTTVNNQLTVLDLQHGDTRTHVCCNSNIQAFDLSPDGDLALCIGNRGLGVFYCFSSEVAVDTISVPPKCEVRCVRFSPCGHFVALGLETTLQIYSCPTDRVVTYHGCHRVEHIHNAMSLPITNIEWTADSEHVLVSGGDAKITIFPRDVRNRKGKAAMRNHLIGHRGAVMGAYWTDSAVATSAISVSVDNVVIAWKRTTMTRKELMRAVAKTRIATRVSEIDGASDDDDAVPESFIERQKKADLKEAIAADDGEALADKRVTKGSDAEFSDVLKYAYEVGKKHLLQHRGTVSKCAYHQARRLLAIGYANGIFAIHGFTDEFDLPLMHFLSISSQSLTALSFSATGDHVSIGSEHLKQLMVWDWRGESYVLKEQSHYYDINVTGITPDGSTIISGGEDGKVKVWKRSNGQCFANFSDHTAGITGLACSPNTNAFFTASKDGTCRGYDLVRFRNFRVFSPAKTTQFSCVSIDPSGEILAAGSARDNVVTLWSVRTGKIIDEFTGHQGPITALQFHPDGTALTTAAMDKTIMVWKIFTTTNDGERLRDEAETFNVDTEVLSLSYASNGKRLAALLLTGDVMIYDAAVSSELTFLTSFRTKFDAAGGWADNIGPNSANANAHFTSVALSPDGDTALLGGESKWLCAYHTSQGYLVNKWPVTSNLDYEGAEEQFNHRGVTEAGVMVGEIDVANDDPNIARRKIIEMPGSRQAHFATGKRKTKLAARTLHLTFAPHGRDFVAATTAGLLVFSMDIGRQKFAPLQLRAHVTTGSVRALLAAGTYTTALIGALLLKDETLGAECMLATPRDRIAVVIPVVPSATFAALVQWVANLLLRNPCLDHTLAWADAVLLAAEEPLFGHARSAAVASSLRLLHRSVAQHRDLADLVDSNDFLMNFVANAAKAAQRLRGATKLASAAPTQQIPVSVAQAAPTAADDNDFLDDDVQDAQAAATSETSPKKKSTPASGKGKDTKKDTARATPSSSSPGKKEAAAAKSVETTTAAKQVLASAEKKKQKAKA